MQFREDSYALNILKYISYSGEMPWTSLQLLPGQYRMNLRYLKRLRDQKFVTVNGTKDNKTIRMTTLGKNILEKKAPHIYSDYMYNSNKHHFSGGTVGHVVRNRNFRLNEVCCMLALIDAKIWSSEKPALFLNNTYSKISDISEPYFYYSREIKNVDEKQRYKTEFTRILGMLVSEGGVYNIYNTNKSLIKWNNQGENKVQVLTEDIVNMNFELPWLSKNEKFKSQSAIIFGKDLNVIPNILNNKNRKKDENGFEMLSFDNSYEDIYFVPIDYNGAVMLKLLVTPDHNKKIIDILFKEKNEFTNNSHIDCDYTTDNIHYLLFFDGNIAKLRKFYYTANLYSKEKFKIMCFPFQYDIIKLYTNDTFEIETVPITTLYPQIIENSK